MTAAEIKKGVETLVTAERSELVTEIKKGVDTLVTAERSGLVAEIKQGIDTIIDDEKSKDSILELCIPHTLNMSAHFVANLKRCCGRI